VYQTKGLEMQPCDEPLFVLKYQKRKLVLYIVGVLVLMPMLYICLFVIVASSILDVIVGKLGALLLFFMFASFLAEMLLFKEIRLYRDKIVKEWRLLGSRELGLAEVGLISQSWATSGIGAKCFFRKGMSPFWRWLMSFVHSIGITYKENLADQKKVKQLNSLLAELSGRKIEEFEQTVTMERLMERGKM
jgi:hypothetical protein